MMVFDFLGFGWWVFALVWGIAAFVQAYQRGDNAGGVFTALLIAVDSTFLLNSTLHLVREVVFH